MRATHAAPHAHQALFAGFGLFLEPFGRPRLREPGVVALPRFRVPTISPTAPGVDDDAASFAFRAA